MNLETNAIITRDGKRIYYKDWGTGHPVVFSHGWPLSSDAFEDEMFSLATRGFRCIAHDRRGHGRSSQPWAGNDLDTYADDLAELIENLDLRDAIFVGHSVRLADCRSINRTSSSNFSTIVSDSPTFRTNTLRMPPSRCKPIGSDGRACQAR